MATVIRIHPTTAEKIETIRTHLPAWSLQTIVDRSIDAFAKNEGIEHKKQKPRRTPAEKSAA